MVGVVFLVFDALVFLGVCVWWLLFGAWFCSCLVFLCWGVGCLGVGVWVLMFGVWCVGVWVLVVGVLVLVFGVYIW